MGSVCGRLWIAGANRDKGRTAVGKLFPPSIIVMFADADTQFTVLAACGDEDRPPIWAGEVE
jgi:hypothetical protein